MYNNIQLQLVFSYRIKFCPGVRSQDLPHAREYNLALSHTIFDQNGSLMSEVKCEAIHCFYAYNYSTDKSCPFMQNRRIS